MVQIVAWKSEADGKIFEDKSKYQAHLRKLARHRLAQRKLQIAESVKDAAWAELYEREQSIDQWMQMVIDNQHLFWAEAAAGDPYDWQNVGKKLSRGKNAQVMPQPRVLKITHQLRWSDMVSNSHSCPVGGVTNWGNRDPDAPTGYPGWQGRMDWVYAWPREWDGVYLGSDLFGGFANHYGRSRVHTGTGGSGGTVFSKKHNCYVTSCGYSVNVFAADWPGLTRHRDKQVMWKTLTNREAA